MPSDIDAIRKRHIPAYPPSYKAHEGPCCDYDRSAWPCDTAQALAALDAAEATLAAYDDLDLLTARVPASERDAARALADELGRALKAELSESDCGPDCRSRRTLAKWEASKGGAGRCRAGRRIRRGTR